jgi:uncharacterized protein YjiS (DUF1127 family)
MKAAAAQESKRIDTAASTAVIAIVKSTYPQPMAVRRAVNDERFPVAELDAWARHAAAAGGFGEGDLTPVRVGSPVTVAPSDSAPAGGRGSRASLWMIVRAIGTAIGDHARAIALRWRAYREMRRTCLALGGLDERTLRDIGVSDGEIGSIAAELAGRAERTRIQALRTLRDLAL